MELKTGLVVIFFPEKGFINIDKSFPDIKTEIIEANKINENEIIKLFGREISSNTFKLHQSLMRISPNSISLTNPPGGNIKASVLLPLKLLLSDNKRHGGYWLVTKLFQGIQIGVPEKGDETIFINIYPPSGRHYQMVFGGFNQSEINEFLSTMTLNDN